MNYPMELIGFFRGLERAIEVLTGEETLQAKSLSDCGHADVNARRSIPFEHALSKKSVTFDSLLTSSA